MQRFILGSLSVLMASVAVVSPVRAQGQPTTTDELDSSASSESLELRGRSLGDYQRFFNPDGGNLDGSAFNQTVGDDRVETVYRHPQAAREAPAFFAPNGQLDEDVRMDYRLSD